MMGGGKKGPPRPGVDTERPRRLKTRFPNVVYLIAVGFVK